MTGQAKLLALHGRVSESLGEIASMFDIPVKITLVVRTPTLADGGILMSDDDHDLAIAEINRLRKKAPHV